MAPAMQPKRNSAPVFICCSRATSTGSRSPNRPSPARSSIWPPTMPPMPDARASARVSNSRTVGSRVDFVAGDDVEGERQQPVAGQDRGGVVGLLVQGRPAAAQIAVVHRRQIVMDQRIAVDAFERGAGQQRGVARHAEHGRTLDHQERPQPFSAAEARIAHRLHQPLRPRDFVGQQRVRQQLRRAGLRCPPRSGPVVSRSRLAQCRSSSKTAPDRFGRDNRLWHRLRQFRRSQSAGKPELWLANQCSADARNISARRKP